MAKCTKSKGTTVCMIMGFAPRPFYYDKGFKYCSRCVRTFSTEERCCLCCNTPLRINPRGRKAHDDLKKRMRQEPHLH